MEEINNSLEKKKRFIINTIVAVLVLGLFYVFMEYVFWLVFPFILAFLLASVLQKPINFAVKKTRMKKGLASALALIILFLLIIGPISLIIFKLSQELRDFWGYVKLRLSDIPLFVNEIKLWLTDFLSFLPDSAEASAMASLGGFLDRISGAVGSETVAVNQSGFDFSSLITSLASSLKGVIWDTTKSIPMAFVGTLMAIIATCFLTTSYDDVMDFIMRQLPKKKQDTFVRGKSIAVSSIKKMAKAYFLIFLITFCELITALLFFKLIGIFDSAYIPIIAALIAVVDILPVLGTGTVLIPWGIISLITGKTGLGIALLITYVVILVIRQIMEPKMISFELGLNPVITLLMIYVSFQLFGFLGMFFTVILVTIIKILNDEEVIHLWKKKERPPGEEKQKKKPLFGKKEKANSK